MIETFDDCLLELGNPGRYRMVLYILLLANMYLVAINFTLTIYTGFVPNHHCRLPINSSWLLNQSVPLIESNEKFELDQCHLWVDPANTSLGKTTCTKGWEYELEGNEWFVSTQFDLVCEHQYQINLGISLQYFGIMLGGIIFGFLSDNLGRRKSLIIAMLGHSFFSIVLSFSNSAPMYFIFAFLLGFFIQGLHSCSYTISCELFHPSQRTIQGVFIGMPWSLSALTMAAIFSGIQNWSYVQLFAGSLSLIGVIYVWLIPESLRWHMARGNVDEMWEIAQKFARFNKIQLRASLRDEFVKLSANMVDNKAKSGSEFLKELLTSKKLKKYTLFLGLTYFSASAIYLGIALAIPKLGGNKYISYMISGSLEMTARIIPIFIYQKFGRRKPLSFFIFICSVMCLLSAILRYSINLEGSFGYFPIALAIIANLSLTMAFGGIGLYITEIFPTLLRSAGLGFCVTLGRIGSMVSPQIVLLEFVWKLLPFVIFCAMGVICAALILLLPETNKKPLPDSVADVGKMNRKSVS